MDARTTELIAIGASAAVNCHPCLQHHLADCDRLSIDRKEVSAAVEVGMMVNKGAAAQTRKRIQTLFGGAEAGKGGCSDSGCGCG